MSAPTSQKMQTAGTAAGIGGGLMAGLGALGVASGPVGWAGLGLAALGSSLGVFGGKKAKKEAKEKALKQAESQTSINVGKQKLEVSSGSGINDKQTAETSAAGQEAELSGLTANFPAKKPEGQGATTPPATTTPPAEGITTTTTTDPATTPPAGATPPAGTDTTGVTTEQIQKGAQTSSTINAAGNLVNAGVSAIGLLSALNAKPVDPIQPHVAKAPKAPELVDDNTEAVRIAAQSKVQGNLGSAEKTMMEMGVNPAMVQSIKASQGNQADTEINANLAANKTQIQAANAQTVNQNNQLESQVSMNNAQAINQTNLVNSQRQAQANQFASQSMMQNLGALTTSMQNIGKGKLDSLLFQYDLDAKAKYLKKFGIEMGK